MDDLDRIFFDGICGICGHKRGECVETKDAGNFLIGGWQTEFGFSHEIPSKYPIRVKFKAVIPAGMKLRVIKKGEDDGLS